ncbi:Flp family type IVb pilin [Pseudarthrobacter sp. efr-133-R2A-89]|uniref:Flp family type IVb pilin n=1 Tax=Pseudarthrobacter sp. efr-133-R2A-89 TaxID=3040302 RepID=UPI0025555979|nr:Flp family type IVb pilin [Pseudarthrobacter sp. efr-133-R2A-89]
MLSLYTNLMIRLRSEEKGATAVEYGIMVALIAVVIITAVGLLGGTLQDMFTQVKCSMVGGTLTARAGDVAASCSK